MNSSESKPTYAVSTLGTNLPARLNSMNAPNFRSNNFDLIRLAAATQVVLLHGYEHFGIQSSPILPVILNAFPGVPIFFVISGFLISASWGRNPNPIRYAQNRFLRIYPGLWVCFILSVISVFLFYNPVFTWREFAVWVVAQLSIGQFYNPDFLRGYGVSVLNGSLWTIPVELQFYVVLPLIYLAFNRIRWNAWVLAILFIAAVVLNQVYIALIADGRSLYLKLLGVTVAPYFYMFLVGVLIQRNLGIVSRVIKGRTLQLLAAYVLLAIVAARMGIDYGGNYINPASAIVLGLLTISFAFSFPGLSERVLHGNDISYGVYIYHMVIVNALIALALFGPWTQYLVMLLLTLAIALLSWKFVERPALSHKVQSMHRPDLPQAAVHT